MSNYRRSTTLFSETARSENRSRNRLGFWQATRHYYRGNSNYCTLCYLAPSAIFESRRYTGRRPLHLPDVS